MNYMEFN